MGFLDTVKGAAKSLISFGEYRNSTLYDFSNVVRASFYVFKYDSAKESFEKLGVLPVQVNPKSYKRVSAIGKKGEISTESIIQNNRESGEADNTMTFDLDFNIVDEYRSRTNNGVLPISCSIDEVTIINALYDCASPEYRVLLKWGTLAFLARIGEISCSYKSFSPYGEPLSAEVSLKLIKHRGNFKSEDTDISAKEALGVSTWAQITTSSKSEELLVRAQIAKQELSAEALPALYKLKVY